MYSLFVRGLAEPVAATPVDGVVERIVPRETRPDGDDENAQLRRLPSGRWCAVSHGVFAGRRAASLSDQADACRLGASLELAHRQYLGNRSASACMQRRRSGRIEGQPCLLVKR